VIIGLSVGAVYLIQPYVDFVTKTFGVGNNSATVENNQNTSEKYLQTFQDLLK
jgi:hypothetical protein